MASLSEIENVRLPDSFGHEKRVGDLWAHRPVAVVWLRHYG